jgi:hypothetical protein
MVASKDHGATLMINNVVILGISLPARSVEPEFPSEAHVEPGLHHSNMSLGKQINCFCSGNSRWGRWYPLHVWRSPCLF